MCVEGAKALYDYCETRSVPYKRIGKLIVATDDVEMHRLHALYERGLMNKVPGLELVDRATLREISPFCEGKAAIWSPNTGIISYPRVVDAYTTEFCEMGGEVLTNFEVVGTTIVDDRNEGKFVLVMAKDGRTIRARKVVTCAGLHSDRVAKQHSRSSNQPAIIPFRGTWLTLKDEFKHMVNTNIYPVPDPSFPWLGVHFTPTITSSGENGDVLLGPNAVLATKREGYSYRDVDIDDMIDIVQHRGLRKMALENVRFGLTELWRDINVHAYVRALNKFMPSLDSSMISGRYSGVRALAMDNNGMVDDFVFEAVEDCILNVRNAPSPAATASLSIGEGVADKATEVWGEI